jgi:hypothetical protein
LNESGVSFAVVEWGNKAIDEKSNYLHNNPVEEGSVFKAEQYIYYMVVPSTTPEVKDCPILFRFNYLPHDTIVRQQGTLRDIKKKYGNVFTDIPVSRNEFKSIAC